MNFFKPFELPTGAQIPEREFLITDFGAMQGGAVKNTDAIAAAIRAAAGKGGGRVIIPAGKWLTGPIHLLSRVELHLERGCEVLFSTDKEDYLPAVFTLYEGMRCYTYSAQLYARDCHDIAVTGEGIFNGQGFVWWYLAALYREGVDDMYQAGQTHRPLETRVYDREEHGVRPGLLHFINCRNITIAGCTFKFSPFWTVHPAWCENILIRNIQVLNPSDHAPNTDGCNLEGCRRALADGIKVDTGDDAVCLKSGRDEEGRLMNRPCQDVIIRNLTVNRCHGGITVGSEMSGGVSNILVENCHFQSVFIGIWIKTAPERGGYIRDIEYHNIRADHVWRQGICFTMGYYTDSYEPENCPFMPEVGNILIEGFRADRSETGVWMEGVQGHPLRNVCLKNVLITADQNIRTCFIENLNMENVTFLK